MFSYGSLVMCCQFFLVLYDKLLLSEMRKQRKMGHITLVGQSMGVLERRLQCILSGQSDQVHGQFTFSIVWYLNPLAFS